MHQKDRFIGTFSRLGDFLAQFREHRRNDHKALESLNNSCYEDFRLLTENEHIYNPWFTPEFVSRAISGIAQMLKEPVLRKWTAAYPASFSGQGEGKTIGLVLAGNIPLVGFHDVMCVLATGHNILAKPSSKDERLMKEMVRVLAHIEPDLEERILFTDGPLKGMDAVIATGSDNSARYFDYYFRDIPHIIRRNRNGIAVLTGQESGEDLAGLGEDVFTYFGLGCRNVTKLYVPEAYDLTTLMAAFDRYGHLYQHHKYGNNVDYYRTIYLMNKMEILDNGVLLLKEDRAIASPVGVVFYERYSDIEQLLRHLASVREEIQCCVSIHPEIEDALLPGTTQSPMPWDYADGIDTMRFLTELN